METGMMIETSNDETGNLYACCILHTSL